MKVSYLTMVSATGPLHLDGMRSNEESSNLRLTHLRRLPSLRGLERTAIRDFFASPADSPGRPLDGFARIRGETP